MIDPQAYVLQGNPMQSLTQGLGSGLQIGMALRERQDARAIAEQQRLQQEAMQQELNDLSQAPTQEKMTAFMIRNPAIAEKMKTGWDSMTETQHKVATNTSIEALSALGSNNPAVAKQAIEKRALAFENAGDVQQANAYKAIAKQIEFDPNGAKTSLMLIASQGAKPDQLAQIYSTLGKEGREQQLFPTAQEQANADLLKTEAETAKTLEETDWIAPQAESQIVDREANRMLQQQDQQLKNDQFYATLDQDQEQFYAGLEQKERANVKALAKAKENTIQRTERLEKANSFASAASTAATTAKLAAELINDYKKLSNATGAGIFNAAMRNIPGTDEYDFARRVDTLQSQAFLIGAQNLKGLGAMTEAEGKKVTDALGSLNLSQSTDQVERSLADIAKMSANLAKTANKNAQIYATKGKGYSSEIVEAAKARGVSPAEMQKIANQAGL